MAPRPPTGRGALGGPACAEDGDDHWPGFADAEEGTAALRGRALRAGRQAVIVIDSWKIRFDLIGANLSGSVTVMDRRCPEQINERDRRRKQVRVRACVGERAL
jgi:hypothetical protein